MNTDKNKWIFGIALSDGKIDDHQKITMKKEYGLSNNDIKELKPAHLFRLSDNVRFMQFDADIILWNGETYYPADGFEPIGQVENKDIIALVDENCEVEII